MVNTMMLRGKMVERGFTQQSISDAIGMDKATFNRKINNYGRGFTVGEANAIVRVLPLTMDEAMVIFFTDIVADKRQERNIHK